jgi:hypothetical protein
MNFEYTYDNAIICSNGHVINRAMEKEPHNNAEHCKDCGGEAVTKCPKCKSGIEGAELISGSRQTTARINYLGGRGSSSPPKVTTSIGSYNKSPNYCKACGEAYPWTENKIKEAIQILCEFGELSDAEKETIEEDVKNITKDVPGSKISAMRIGRICLKASKVVYDEIKGMATDTAAKTINEMMK